MDELIQAMTNAELLAMKKKHADNESVVKIVDAVLAGRDKAEEQAKVIETFEATITTMAEGLPHPDTVHNVYLAWREVEEAIPNSEAVEVEVTNAEGVKSKVMRQPMQKVAKWVVEVNKAMQVKSGGSGNSTSKTPKRAIVVEKRDGNTIVPVGEYANASEACKALKLIVGGDSAMRVLAREEYLVTPLS